MKIARNGAPTGEGALPGPLVRLWRQLGSRRQRQFVALLVLMVVSAVAEVISLGAIVPFLAVLTAPDRLLRNPFVAGLATRLGIDSPHELLLPFTIFFVAAALVGGAIRMLLVWVSTRFTFATGADLSMEVYRRTLYQPYSIHVVRSSSDIISGIISKVGSTVLGVVLPVLTLVSSSVLVLAIMLTLIAINAPVALIAIVGFGLSYGLVTTIFRRRLRANSLRIAREHSQMIRTLQEGLGGIRDVLLDGTQPIYCEAYRRSDRQLRRAQGSNVFLAQSPRFALESIGMVLIAALAFTLSRNAGGIAAGLPALGALALGAQRLLPAMQQAYASWATIAGNHASLVDTLDLLDQPIPDETLAPQPPPLQLQKAVSFRGIRFRYTVAGPWILDGLELEIPKGAKVGFIGQTGSGKSTALDIFMGLLTPTEGLVLVDGEPLAGQRLRSWQRSIAHVPQSIFLADISFAQNIAFGVPDRDIDMARVREAARQAQIAEFIEGRPGGYDGVVGERGIQLSGGQRQRIGIARALYRNGSVLVLDEATSALDNSTEQSVMEAIASLPGELTVLIIAHRLSTVSRCDFLVELDGGKITAVGTYRDLLERSPSFQRMALATNSNQTDPI